MSQLAIKGGQPTKTKPFPPWPQYDEREMDALRDVLESRAWWSTAGTQTTLFEQEFAAFHNAKYGVAMTNGTHAIEAVMLAQGIGPGDEVIVPDFTFIATASAVLSVGALPVLVDVERDTYNIDPSLVEAAITPRTKAIIAVHMGGHSADLDRLTEIADHHQLALFEDSSHAHASEWRGKRIGAVGLAGTFSFQASKTMTGGEGGIVLTNDADFERKLRSVQDCGRLPGHHFYEHFNYGSNYRLSEWQGAVLRVQLTRLDEQTKLRDTNARYLNEHLAKINGITPQIQDMRATRNGHYLYIFHYDSAAFGGASPARFIEALAAEGIPNQATYPPLHALEVFHGGGYRERLAPEQNEDNNALRHGPFVNSVRALEESICLPQYTLLGDEADMDEIVAAVQKIQQNAAELV